MRRRTFLQGLGAVTGAAVTSALEPWQRLSAALHQPRGIDWIRWIISIVVAAVLVMIAASVTGRRGRAI